MLIPIDSLTTHAYMEPEMIAYHQSAYISQYLIETFVLRNSGCYSSQVLATSKKYMEFVSNK
jgi:hypothetical protein